MFKRKETTNVNSLRTPSKSKIRRARKNLSQTLDSFIPDSVADFKPIHCVLLFACVFFAFAIGAISSVGLFRFGVFSKSAAVTAEMESNIDLIRWYWVDDTGKYSTYRDDVCEDLEETYQAWNRYNGPSSLLTFVGRHSTTGGRYAPQSYHIDMETMTQTNAITGHQRDIKRIGGMWFFATDPRENKRKRLRQPYLDEQQEQLEEAYHAYEHMGGDAKFTFTLVVEGIPKLYEVDFEAETQTNMATGHIRQISRK